MDDYNTLIKTIFGLISGLALECAGIYFIYAGITGVGTTSVQILSFTISAGSIGVVVIFIGVILQYATITHNSIIEESSRLVNAAPSGHAKNLPKRVGISSKRDGTIPEIVRANSVTRGEAENESGDHFEIEKKYRREGSQ